MLIIDRFEGKIAIIEDQQGNTYKIPRQILPHKAREGDVIKIIIDQDTTEKRKERIEILADELFE